jgi:hypothetical protein
LGLSKEWQIGTRQHSTVSDWKKLIRDFRDQFPYDPLSALVVETFANSLDANATKIEIQIDSGAYRIADNGNGMSLYDFKEYHNVASLTKRRGEGIGFAGVGAKIFLDRAEFIVTETKSAGFSGATHWAFYDDSLEWEPIPTINRVNKPSGTFVEVKLKDAEDTAKLTPQFVKEVLQQYYNAVLLGYYNARSVLIDGREVEPWQVPTNEIEKRKEFDLRCGKHRVKGFVVKSTKSLPEEYQGPFIVVYGKTVMQWWFRQFPLSSETFYGLILADHLIDILRTSKSDFERTSMMWKIFQGKTGRAFSKWLDEIGAKPTPPSLPTDLEEMSRELEKSINQVLKMPELAELANTIFQNIVQRSVAIKSAQVDLVALKPKVIKKQPEHWVLQGKEEV